MKKLLNLNSQYRVLDFIMRMEDETDRYVIEDEQGFLRVNAHSITGVLYASRDFDNLYLVNCTNDGYFPSFVEEFK